MDTHLMIGVAVMFGLIAIAGSRDLLRRLREQQPQLAPIRIERRVRGNGTIAEPTRHVRC
ncbi:hypothetical protein PQQ51_07885 [Paraburkholderia xenovorans]|uniref:hypothetical protein n=1 Tax=Paraburkholderia xenovorans TaxID=36873 RepID=UPI0038B72E7D